MPAHEVPPMQEQPHSGLAGCTAGTCSLGMCTCTSVAGLGAFDSALPVLKALTGTLGPHRALGVMTTVDCIGGPCGLGLMNTRDTKRGVLNLRQILLSH